MGFVRSRSSACSVPLLAVATLAATSLVGVACGGSPAPLSPPDDAGGADHHAAPDGPRLVFDGGGGGDGGAPADASCAAVHAKATLAPAYLVIVMDRSNSMKQDMKWTTCSAALTSFFSSTKASAGLSASLTWLPTETGSPPAASCDSSDYDTPVVPMTALPSSAFGPVISATVNYAGTPTLAALTGSVAYAATVQKAHPDGKVVIVLATDGKPAGCKSEGNSLTSVAAEAASALSTYGLYTYVIGVGTALTNLDTIAASGGTKTALLVDTSDPSKTAADFAAAIESIQTSLGCAYPIPAPMGGGTIDYTKVNVELTSGGKTSELPYSSDCSNPDGWHYDDPKKPAQIELCSAACKSAGSDVSGSIDILFGCDTIGMPPK